MVRDGLAILLILAASAAARADRALVTAAGLPIDLTRAAVRSSSAPGPGAERLVHDWWVMPLSQPVASAAALREVLDGMVEGDVRFASPILIGAHGGMVIPTDVVLLDYPSPPLPADMNSEAPGARLSGWTAARPWAHMPELARIEAPEDVRNGFEVLDVAEQLSALPGVRSAEANMLQQGTSDYVPSDPQFAQSWSLRNTGQSGGVPGLDLNAWRAWDWTLGSPGIIAVVIDVGIYRSHPDLLVGPGIDSTGDQGDGGALSDCDWHGTWVGGALAARANNGLGTCGVAPNITLGTARTMIGGCGVWYGESEWTITSLNWVVAVGARVTNNSNSYPFQSPAIAAAYQASRAAGVVHFASAGNNSAGSVNYPGILPTVNAVASLNRFGQFSEFSNAGDGLDFIGPGESIFATDPPGPLGFNSGDYATVGGTSMAAPATAGVAALVLSVYPYLTAEQVESVLQRSARDLGPEGFDETFGWGLTNARAAIFTACPPDFNRDGVLNQEDLTEFLTAWLTEPTLVGVGGYAVAGCPGLPKGYLADFDGNCTHDQEDLSQFLTGYFLESESPVGCLPG